MRSADGRIDVTAREVRRAEVLRAIARHANVVISGEERADEACSLELAGVSIDEALRSAVGEYDYVMSWPDPALSAIGIARVRLWVYVPPDKRTAVDDPALGPEDTTRDANDPSLTRLEAAAFFERATDSSLLEAAAWSEVAAVRRRALQALTDRHAARELEASVAAVDEADRSVSADAEFPSPGSQQRPALDNIRAMLRDPDPGGRLRALEWLEVRADPESLPAAREAINDQDEAVRRTARRLVETLDGLRGPKPHQ